MRLISTIHKASAEATAKVYRDTEWQEYRVKFYRGTIHQVNADYHTEDKQDAIDTAHGQLQRYSEE
jgi:hypothetical protein